MPLQPQEIIPAVRHAGDFLKAASTEAAYIILSGSSINELLKIRKICRRRPELQLLVHLDMIKGLSETEESVSFLTEYVRPSGIISANPRVISTAKKHELWTVQCCFIVDEESLDYSLHLIEKSRPDCVQVKPGLMPDILRLVKEKSRKEMLAGGLIRTMAEAEAAKKAGAAMVATSSLHLLEEAAACRSAGPPTFL